MPHKITYYYNISNGNLNKIIATTSSTAVTDTFNIMSIDETEKNESFPDFVATKCFRIKILTDKNLHLFVKQNRLKKYLFFLID